jgi:hypothetical protein
MATLTLSPVPGRHFTSSSPSTPPARTSSSASPTALRPELTARRDFTAPAPVSIPAHRRPGLPALLEVGAPPPRRARLAPDPPAEIPLRASRGRRQLHPLFRLHRSRPLLGPHRQQRGLRSLASILFRAPGRSCTPRPPADRLNGERDRPRPSPGAQSLVRRLAGPPRHPWTLHAITIPDAPTRRQPRVYRTAMRRLSDCDRSS